MGVLVMTGLACFGGAVAIGMVASSTIPTVGFKRGEPSIRGLAIILIAFCEGPAVLGVSVGLLAIYAGLVQDASSGMLAAGVAVIGASLGIGLIAANWARTDRSVAAYGMVSAAALGSLGIVVAIVASVIHEIGLGTIAAWPFAVLGTASALSTVAIGATGARSLRSMDGSDAADIKAIAEAQISRSALFLFVAVGAAAIAGLLVVLA